MKRTATQSQNNHSHRQKKGRFQKNSNNNKNPNQQQNKQQRRPFSHHPSSSSSDIFQLNPKVPISNSKTFTISIALPGSILQTVQTTELKTYLTGQVARCLSIFGIDEIIIYDEDNSPSSQNGTTEGQFESVAKKNVDSNLFMSRVLEYLEAPPYLRKLMFPVHRDLKYAGLLNAIEIPSHMRIDDVARFREGYTMEETHQGKSLVDCGLRKPVKIDQKLMPKMRVTVEFEHSRNSNDQKNYTSSERYITGKVISLKVPKEEFGLYWGYQVRVASSLSKVFEDCPFGAYDVTIGTSEKGDSPLDLFKPYTHGENDEESDTKSGLKPFNHLLIVFGGQKGLEIAFDSDENIKVSSDNAHEMFDYWVNVCPGQCSRSIRTEEALYITLSLFQSLFEERGI